jgi:hypothetical protein
MENETAVGGSQRPKIYSFEHWCLFRGCDGHARICLVTATFSRGRPFGQAIREVAFARLLCTRFCICDRSELVGLENGPFREMAQGLVAAASVFNHGQHNWVLAYENARKQALIARSHGIPEDIESGVVLGFLTGPRCHETESRGCAWRRKRGGAPAWELACRPRRAQSLTSAASLRNTKRKSFQWMKSDLWEASRFARNLVLGASTGL